MPNPTLPDTPIAAGRPYSAWLHRHAVRSERLALAALVVAIAAVTYGVWGLTHGQSAVVYTGAAGAMVGAFLHWLFERDATQCWRALRAWERGANEIPHLPWRLRRDVGLER